MWGRLTFVGVLLLAVSVLTDSGGYDEEADELRSLRESGGVETIGKLRGTFERERSRGTRRSRSTYTVSCGEYAYRVDDQDFTHLEFDQCEEEESDLPATLALLYDRSEPSEVHNNTDEWLESQERQSDSVWWFRIAGGVIVAIGLVGLASRIKRRISSRASGPAEVGDRSGA